MILTDRYVRAKEKKKDTHLLSGMASDYHPVMRERFICAQRVAWICQRLLSPSIDVGNNGICSGARCLMRTLS